MFWFNRKPIGERPLTKSEAEAYEIGYDDGVRMVLDSLLEIGPDSVGEEVKTLTKRLIIEHTLQTAGREPDEYP